jgi:hypothetical protein
MEVMQKHNRLIANMFVMQSAVRFSGENDHSLAASLLTASQPRRYSI